MTVDRKVKARAWHAVLVAKRRGVLVPQPCEVCGSDQNIEAHHEDYSQAERRGSSSRSRHDHPPSAARGRRAAIAEEALISLRIRMTFKGASTVATCTFVKDGRRRTVTTQKATGADALDVIVGELARARLCGRRWIVPGAGLGGGSAGLALPAARGRRDGGDAAGARRVA